MITQEQLQNLVYYSKEKGELYWKQTRGGAHQGQRLGSAHRGPNSRTVYLRAEILGERYFVHNLIWLYETGELCLNELDHVDRNGRNNKFSNLRKATLSQNKANSPIYSNNTSGYPGVRLGGSNWIANISSNGKRIHLGSFPTKALAVEARQKKELELFGEFARV